MRWLVEVSALGKSDLQELHVEADTWQRALQEARAQRGESGPMSGFSIELLEEGYRAVDPVARVRFVVKRAEAAPRPSAPPPAAGKTTLIGVGVGLGEGAKKGGVGSPVAGLPNVTVLSSRVQEPSEAVPLAYREYAFAVPAGTTEEVSADVLRGQLRLVQSELGESAVSKLVQLAAFDVAYTGKPPVPPLATLTWKDWKGEPVIQYPRRGGAVAMPSRPPTKAPSSMPPPTPAVTVAVAAPSPVPVFSAPIPAQVQAPSPAQAPPAKRDSVRVSAAAVPAPLIAQAPLAEGNGLVRTPSGRFIRGRVSADELITSLFEAMHDLHFLRDALDGGQFCLALATEMLPSRAAFIHFYDVEKREWVVACTRGEGTRALLATRSPSSDEILREAAQSRRAVVHAAAHAGGSDRYAALGGSKSIVVAPIMQAGRALGAIEIVNPLDGAPFTADEGNAVTYIAEQYAEYLGSRGIVLDRTRIQAAATAP